MSRELDKVDRTIARFEEMAARMDARTPPAPGARRRDYGGNLRSVGRKAVNIGIAIGVLIAATIGFGLIVGPIGLTGLFLVGIAILFVLIFFAMRPDQPARVAYSEELPTRRVVQQLDSFLVRRRTALPAPAARRVDAISAQLPLLESRLGEVDMLDPLAQDARRLMGKHLPELIERYERVPPVYRAEKDGEGMSMDERLVASLDAAREALADISEKLTRQDRDAFEVQGRFIESRYRDGGGSAQ